MSIRNHATHNQLAFAGQQSSDVAGQFDAVDGVDDMHLGEGATGFQTANPDNPLKRNVIVSIRSSLSELCKNAGRGLWEPSPDALRAIYQQKQFISLSGKQNMQGDLKAIVLHNVSTSNVHSTFPIALGAHITGVDEQTFSAKGTPYSLVVMPNASNNTPTVLQKDDVSIGMLTYPNPPSSLHALSDW
jgi:hypothetical protein